MKPILQDAWMAAVLAVIQASLQED